MNGSSCGCCSKSSTSLAAKAAQSCGNSSSKRIFSNATAGQSGYARSWIATCQGRRTAHPAYVPPRSDAWSACWVPRALISCRNASRLIRRNASTLSAPLDTAISNSIWTNCGTQQTARNASQHARSESSSSSPRAVPVISRLFQLRVLGSRIAYAAFVRSRSWILFSFLFLLLVFLITYRALRDEMHIQKGGIQWWMAESCILVPRIAHHSSCSILHLRFLPPELASSLAAAFAPVVPCVCAFLNPTVGRIDAMRTQRW